MNTKVMIGYTSKKWEGNMGENGKELKACIVYERKKEDFKNRMGRWTQKWNEDRRNK
jgi:hypothetical protein